MIPYLESELKRNVHVTTIREQFVIYSIHRPCMGPAHSIYNLLTRW